MGTVSRALQAHGQPARSAAGARAFAARTPPPRRHPSGSGAAGLAPPPRTVVNSQLLFQVASAPGAPHALAAMS